MKYTLDLELLATLQQQLDTSYAHKTHTLLTNRNIDQISLRSSAYNTIQNKFTIDLLGLSAQDQHATGRCWLFATLNWLRYHFTKAYRLETFAFSTAYLHFYDKLERANYWLELVLAHPN